MFVALKGQDGPERKQGNQPTKIGESPNGKEIETAICRPNFQLDQLKAIKTSSLATAKNYLLNPNSTTISPKLRNMNGYSLVIDISSDEEYARTSTSLKSLPLYMVGSLSDSSTEVFEVVTPN